VAESRSLQTPAYETKPWGNYGRRNDIIAVSVGVKCKLVPLKLTISSSEFLSGALLVSPRSLTSKLGS
jgi:hypothetical protein